MDLSPEEVGPHLIDGGTQAMVRMGPDGTYDVLRAAMLYWLAEMVELDRQRRGPERRFFGGDQWRPEEIDSMRRRPVMPMERTRLDGMRFIRTHEDVKNERMRQLLDTLPAVSPARLQGRVAMQAKLDQLVFGSSWECDGKRIDPRGVYIDLGETGSATPAPAASLPSKSEDIRLQIRDRATEFNRRLMDDNAKMAHDICAPPGTVASICSSDLTAKVRGYRMLERARFHWLGGLYDWLWVWGNDWYTEQAIRSVREMPWRSPDIYKGLQLQPGLERAAVDRAAGTGIDPEFLTEPL